MTGSRITVLMCTRNRGVAATRCLESLIRQDYPHALVDVCVLDDSSSDGSADMLRPALELLKASGFAEARLFVNEQNVQIAAGRRFLQKQIPAGADFVCYLDDDAELPPGALSALAGFLRENAEVGAAGPRIAAMSSPEVTAHMANFVSWIGLYSEKDANIPLDCDWLNSTCLMTRNSALAQAGGFYPGFYTAHEEVDFCLKLKNFGWRVVYLPGLTVLHDIVPGGTKRERLYYLYRNKFLVFRRNFGFIRFAAAAMVTLLFGLPKYVLESLRAGSPGEVFLILRAVAHGLSGREGPRRD
jgi:N-acetylglucosaminyl-diphospho-decaprenol L-rhamnosyltransferase